jgi:hypothetical protein
VVGTNARKVIMEIKAGFFMLLSSFSKKVRGELPGEPRLLGTPFWRES